MATESRHVSVHIARPVAEVYEFVSDPANLPRWAHGLGPGVEVTFATRNDFGVLDHDVLTPAGETVHVPLRVIADGRDCELVFTVRRPPGVDDAGFDGDTALVTADLARVKQAVESAAPRG